MITECLFLSDFERLITYRAVMSSEKRTDLWPWYKEILARIETALVAGQPASRARLELVLKEAENDFKNLLENPAPNPTDADSLRKAVTDGIKLQGLFFSN